MADAKSSLSSCLFDISAGIQNCQFVADELRLNDALDDYTKSVIWLLGAKLEQLSDELSDLSGCPQVKSIRLEDAA